MAVSCINNIANCWKMVNLSIWGVSYALHPEQWINPTEYDKPSQVLEKHISLRKLVFCKSAKGGGLKVLNTINQIYLNPTIFLTTEAKPFFLVDCYFQDLMLNVRLMIMCQMDNILQLRSNN